MRGKDVAVSMLKVLIVTMAIFGGGQACGGRDNCSAHSGSKDYCYSARIRSTVLQGLPFGGVPTVLALDFMCFLVSHAVPVLRKHSWRRRSSVGGGRLLMAAVVSWRRRTSADGGGRLTSDHVVTGSPPLSSPSGPALRLFHPEESGVGLRPPGAGH